MVNLDNNLTKKNDFIEISFTGYANGEIFDSNIKDDLKLLDKKAEPQKTIVAIGHKMVVKGLDEALAGKEIGKEYEIDLKPKDSFGERRRELIKTIPLKSFTENKVNPRPGMVLTLDNSFAKIIAVSGARVVTDFNNPLSGKKIHYKFKIIKIVQDDKEKAEALFTVFFKFIPQYEIKDNIIIKGPKAFEILVKTFSEKFKELLGKSLVLEEVKQKENIEENSEDEKEGHEHRDHDHSHEHK